MSMQRQEPTYTTARQSSSRTIIAKKSNPGIRQPSRNVPYGAKKQASGMEVSSASTFCLAGTGITSQDGSNKAARHCARPATVRVFKSKSRLFSSTGNTHCLLMPLDTAFSRSKGVSLGEDATMDTGNGKLPCPRILAVYRIVPRGSHRYYNTATEVYNAFFATPDTAAYGVREYQD